MTRKTRKYLPGSCYTCKKCLFCFTSKACKCEKNTKPTRVSKPNRGQQIYSRVFTPNEELQAANQFLFSANEKFQYNCNFNKSFSFTFCSACNSKFQRLKSSDKLAKRKIRNTKKREVHWLKWNDLHEIYNQEISYTWPIYWWFQINLNEKYIIEISCKLVQFPWDLYAIGN